MSQQEPERTNSVRPSRNHTSFASARLSYPHELAIALMIDLKFGREPSMYTDVKEDGVSVQSPSGLVRPEAAEDCIRLAGDCLANARRHFEGKEPLKTTRAQDEFFAMRSTLTREIMNSVDFWDFHIDRLKVGLSKLEESVTEYNRLYFQKHVNYKASEVDATDT